MKKLPFVKMHWNWNDFIVINQDDLVRLGLELSEDFIQKICNRNFWIWSDWLLLVSKSKKADFKYNMYNPDWSQAEMCGNWIRCYMKYLLDNAITKKNNLDVETLIWILNISYKDNLFTVDMWKPWIIKDISYKTNKLWDRFAIKSSWRDFVFMPISMWNPHAVIFLQNEELKDFDLLKYWKPIENDLEIFPKRTNVEFIEVLSDCEIDMRIWERWAWETLSAWTWAWASVVAWILSWRLASNKFVKVNLRWGILYIKWSWNIWDDVILKWTAETICDWNYYIN